MNKVLLTCGAGASSGFLAQRTRKAISDKGYDIEVKAVSESEVKDYFKDYEVLFVGPHLRYKEEELKKEAEPYGVEVRVIDEEIYGKIDGEKFAETLNDYFKGRTVTVTGQPELNDEEELGASNAKGIIGWMENVFAPKMAKVANNKFVKGIQDSMMTVLPFVMVGSFISILNIIKEYIPAIPDLSLINSFSFGLFSLFLAFLIPLKIMENYGITKFKYYAALAGVSTYMMLMMPLLDEEGNIIYVFEKLGAAGMLVSLITSIFVSLIMLACSKFSFFKKDTTMPDIVVSWTDAMLPIFVTLLISTILFVNGIDVYSAIQNFFDPVMNFSQTLGGILFCSMLVNVLYSFGISSWVIFPVIWAIWMQGIADNQSLVAAGQAAANLNLMEFFHPFVYLGGTGTTLTLVFMMLRSKSDRLKAMGRFTLLPSLLNINEPVVFGTPIAFNPTLMIPMWIQGLVIPLITYFAFKVGFVPVPVEPMQVWYLPVFIYSILAVKSITGLILVLINTAVSAVIWYPFFKAYERQELKKERQNQVN